MEYSYYPGCTLKTKAKELDAAARASAAALGVVMDELPEWQCCGAVYPLARDEIATKLSAVRALAAARAQGRPLLTLCSACHHVIKRVNADMQNDTEIRAKVNNYQGEAESYAGETEVVHYFEMLRDVVGFDRLKERVTHPLAGRRIAAYYGCMLLRPSGVMRFDNPENPSIMEDFVAALGAEPVRFPYRNECCGGYVAFPDQASAREKSSRVTHSAAQAGADALITACPLCLYNLKENGIGDPPKRGGCSIPVYYFTELLAEALGVGVVTPLKEEGPSHAR
jgi:heterodisulfide reductase subunit B